MKNSIKIILAIFIVSLISAISFSCEKIQDDELVDQVENVETTWLDVGNELIILENTKKDAVEKLADYSK